MHDTQTNREAARHASQAQPSGLCHDTEFDAFERMLALGPTSGPSREEAPVAPKALVDIESVAERVRRRALAEARRVYEETLAAGGTKRDAAIDGGMARRRLLTDDLPEDGVLQEDFLKLAQPFVRTLADEFGMDADELLAQARPHYRSAVVARHGDILAPHSRRSAAAYGFERFVRELRYEHPHLPIAERLAACDEVQSRLERYVELGRSGRAAVREMLSDHCPPADLKPVSEAVWIGSVMDAHDDGDRFAVLDALAEELSKLERIPGLTEAAASAVASINRENTRLCLTADLSMSLRDAARSWFAVQDRNPRVHSVTVEENHVAIAVSPSKGKIQTLKDDGKVVSCPSGDHEVIAAAVAAIAARGSKSVWIETADPHKSSVSAYECMKAGLRPLTTLPADRLDFLRDLSEAESAARETAGRPSDMADGILRHMVDLGHSRDDVRDSLHLVFRGAVPGDGAARRPSLAKSLAEPSKGSPIMSPNMSGTKKRSAGIRI